MADYFITGANGFIGRSLADRLRERGDRVAGIDLLAAPQPHLKADGARLGTRQVEREDRGARARVERVPVDNRPHLEAAARRASERRQHHRAARRSAAPSIAADWRGATRCCCRTRTRASTTCGATKTLYVRQFCSVLMRLNTHRVLREHLIRNFTKQDADIEKTLIALG